MADLIQLRNAAREIFDAALRAVDAGEAVRKAISMIGSNLAVYDQEIQLRNRPTYAIALGKAATPMALALEAQLGPHFIKGVISGPPKLAWSPAGSTLSHAESAEPSARWKRFNGGHPLPNEESLRAAEAAFALLDQASTEQANVIFLISGGGSAMMEWPISRNITLDDIRTANKVLVNCGADITEINAVRRAFSAVKGGRLAERALNCQQVTLIVSDVPLGEQSSVASGPSSPVPSTARYTGTIVERYKLRRSLPTRIIKAIDSASATSKPKEAPHWSFVLLTNHDALAAALDAAISMGFAAEIAYQIPDLPIEEGVTALSDQLAAMRARQHGSDKSLCLISGGEFSCPVRGDGLGGRNLETALRLALLKSDQEEFIALCAGTDGIDGNSPAAGAIADHTTIERAKAIGLDGEDFLRRSNSYSFFHALGDDVVTGPTGTNVRDLRILMASS
jgi:hydroxypyruvate reductase